MVRPGSLKPFRGSDEQSYFSFVVPSITHRILIAYAQGKRTAKVSSLVRVLLCVKFSFRSQSKGSIVHLHRSFNYARN
jgi:hypothetical protein